MSFRVTCGAIRLYVVQRLLGVAKEGIQIRKAVLPAGRRKLAGIFTDTLGRKVQRFVALMEC